MSLLSGMLIAITALISWLGTRLVIHHAASLGLLHAPNDRSFHSDPVPHGGGLGLVIAFQLAVSAAAVGGALESRYVFCLLSAGSGIAFLGLWDDISPLPACTRLLVQCVLALAALAIFDRPIDDGGAIGAALWYGGALLMMVWWLNLFNFMDGIDGFAATQCLFLTASALLLLALTGDAGDPSQNLLLWLLLAAALGFLALNWPPARIFLGDVGSLFIAYVIGVLALSTVAQGQLTTTVWLILGAVFLADSTATLLRRILRAERWHTAHRSHAYQRYASMLCRGYEARGANPNAARAKAHRSTVGVLIIINITWLLPLAWLAIIKPGGSVLWLVLAWLPPLLLVIRSGKYE